MANSSDESLQIQTVYGCDRWFFSSPLLSEFLQHRCSITGESDLQFDRFHISFPLILQIRAFNSYFTDESHKSALYEHYRPPHGYLDQMVLLHPTHLE